MKIGLIDVDAANNGLPKFPNLALMRISAHHKAQGDEVEWWMGDLWHYDIVYMSKIFSDAYSPDIPEPLNADKVIKGGTGYCINLVGGVWNSLIKPRTFRFRPKLRGCSRTTRSIRNLTLQSV